MDSETAILLDTLKGAQHLLLRRCQAVRLLVEGCEDARRQKAKKLLVDGGVKWVRVEGAGDEIRALVVGSGKPPVYAVCIDLVESHSGRFRVKRFECECYDHGRTGACKHVLAVVGAYTLNQSKKWKALRECVEVLNPE